MSKQFASSSTKSTFSNSNTEMTLKLYATGVYTTQEMTFSFLKSELKEYKACGYRVEVKLNKKHTPEYLQELQAEYDRLEFTINGVLACELSSDVIGGESEGIGYGWYGKSCEINPQPIQEPVEITETSNTENQPKTFAKHPSAASVAHSFNQMLKQAKRSPSYGFQISYTNRLRQAA